MFKLCEVTKCGGYVFACSLCDHFSQEFLLSLLYEKKEFFSFVLF